LSGQIATPDGAALHSGIGDIVSENLHYTIATPDSVALHWGLNLEPWDTWGGVDRGAQQASLFIKVGGSTKCRTKQAWSRHPMVSPFIGATRLSGLRCRSRLIAMPNGAPFIKASIRQSTPLPSGWSRRSARRFHWGIGDIASQNL
jgi:hypothetical protein